MTKQIKIDVLDVGFHLWTDDEKQHGYTNLTDLLDGLRGLLSGVSVDDGWIEWDGLSDRPADLWDNTVVEVMFRHGGIEAAAEAECYDWTREGVYDYIIAYRVVRT